MSPRPKRVLWLIRGLGPGGAENLLVNIATSSASTVHYEVAFTRADKQQLVPTLEAAGVRVHRLGRLWPVGLARLVLRGGFDVVHSHAPLMASVARVVGRMRPRRPLLVSTEHNLWEAYEPATRVVNALTFGLDDAHFAVSGAVASSVSSRHASNVEVLVHGVDPSTIERHVAARLDTRSSLGAGGDVVLVGIVANYRPHKAWPVMLHAAELVIAENPQVRFVGIGQGPLEGEVLVLHEQLGLGTSFVLLGYHAEAAEVIAALDVFCLSSIQEGLPVAVMEALVAGVPVVATRVGGIPEAVEHGVAGLLVEPGGPRALADAILELAGSSELRGRLGAGAKAAGQAFHIDRAVEVIEARYQKG